MSEVNYYSIEEAISYLFKADADLLALSPTIEIEEDDNLVSDKCPYIGIYLSSWESPHTEERIGGTTPFTTYLVFNISLTFCNSVSLKIAPCLFSNANS